MKQLNINEDFINELFGKTGWGYEATKTRRLLGTISFSIQFIYYTYT